MALAQQDQIVAVVTANSASLLGLARRYSLCEDDAGDAYQRTIELYLGRVHRLEPATAAGWMRTVCKHEAMRIRAERLRLLTPEEVEWDQRPSDDVGDVGDRAESLGRVALAAEALGGCLPDEARAILLRAGGSSYREISRQGGWSYSQVNRLLANGRARFLARFAALESGDACDAFAPVLSAIVDGEATPDDFLAVRPHLRHCSGCRATLRALYESEPALGALLPAGALVVAGPGFVARAIESMSAHVGERVVRAHAAFEAVTSAKAAAVVASAATVAAGGAAAVEHVEHVEHRSRPAAAAVRVAGRVVHRPARVAAVAPTATPAAAAATVTVTATPAPAAEGRATPSPTPEPAEFDPVTKPSPAPVAVVADAPSSAFEGTKDSGRAGGTGGGEFGPEG